MNHKVHVFGADCSKSIRMLIATAKGKVALYSVATYCVETLGHKLAQPFDVVFAVHSAKLLVRAPESLDGGKFTMEFRIKAAHIVGAELRQKVMNERAFL